MSDDSSSVVHRGRRARCGRRRARAPLDDDDDARSSRFDGARWGFGEGTCAREDDDDGDGDDDDDASANASANARRSKRR